MIDRVVEEAMCEREVTDLNLVGHVARDFALKKCATLYSLDTGGY